MLIGGVNYVLDDLGLNQDQLDRVIDLIDSLGNNDPAFERFLDDICAQTDNPKRQSKPPPSNG